MDNFVIRAYGLQELAQLYFPGNTPPSASAQLKKWMKNNQLHAKLTEAGYHSGQKWGYPHDSHSSITFPSCISK